MTDNIGGPSAALQSENSDDLRLYGTAGAVKTLRGENAIFRALTDTLPQMVWSTLANGDNDYFNARWYEYTGVAEGETEGDRWSEAFHPDDAEEAQRRWKHSIETGELYSIEHKLRHVSGTYRWVITRGEPVRDESGAIVRWIGTCTDIDDAKRDVEQNEILSRELSHRIKNIFAVISGLIAISAHRHPESREFAAALQGRVSALGRAHEFVRPHSDRSLPEFPKTSVQAMLLDLMKPYPALAEGRIMIGGADADLDDRTATPLALVFHELATNATKYGALSTIDGTISVLMTIKGEDMSIEWKERGGPLVTGRSERGFGSDLVSLSIERQLSGTLDQYWDEQGLRVVIGVPMARLNP